MKYYPEGKLINTEENRRYLRNPEMLREAFAERKILEGRCILCDREHNLHIDMGCMKGIIPREAGAIGLEDGSVRDIAIISKVNKPVCFVIDDFLENERGETYALLNRRAVQEECVSHYINLLKNGDIIDARVCHMENFGVFADMGAGINSLLPIDSISVSRIPHPDARFYQGQDIKAVVRNRDEQGRIVLSHKELLGTWEENCERFSVGDTVPGIVRSVEKYGIFIELAPNLAGLAEYTENIYPSRNAAVYIKSIIPERMKIKLIIVDSFDGKYPVGKNEYFFKGSHISHWRYSPEDSNKIIETYFE